MTKIVSDNKAIETCIRNIEKDILDHGGWLDPDLIIRCEGGQLSIEKDTYTDPRNPLIAMTQDMLLPTRKMNIYVKGDDMFMAPEAGALTELQTRTAENMLELYNLTGKIRLHRESCCWFTFRNDREALDALLEARSPSLKRDEYYKFAAGESAEDPAKVECDTYVKSRIIGLQNVRGAEPGVHDTYIMPIIDFLNHHVGGANYMLSKGEHAPEVDKFFQVRDHRPIINSNECYAYYNMLDAVDSFISYGFPDSFAPYVRSVPVEIDLGEAGKMIIHSGSGGVIRQRLHKNIAGLRPYIPATLKNEEGILELSHMIIPSMHASPNAMRRVLRMLISGKAARIFNARQIWEKVLETEDRILRTNMEFFAGLERKADEALAKGPNKSWEMVRLIAATERGILAKYVFDADHFADTAVFDPEHQDEIPQAAEAAE